jgi:putative methyltransferase (TIGR04325 family)
LDEVEMGNQWMNPLFSLVRRSLKREPSAEPRIFESYLQALGSLRHSGYQLQAIVDVVIAKTIVARDKMLDTQSVGLETLRPLIALGAMTAGPTIRVVDFGGGAGHHYFLARTALGAGVDLRWSVVETPAMVASARSQLTDRSLSFFSSTREAAEHLGQVDLVFSSSALQYTPDPLLSLREILAVRAEHVFITRTALSTLSETISMVQTSRLANNGPGPLPDGFSDRQVQYPVTFLPKALFQSTLQEAYAIRFEIEEEQAVFRLRGRNISHHGFFGYLSL